MKLSVLIPFDVLQRPKHHSCIGELMERYILLEQLVEKVDVCIDRVKDLYLVNATVYQKGKEPERKRIGQFKNPQKLMYEYDAKERYDNVSIKLNESLKNESTRIWERI